MFKKLLKVWKLYKLVGHFNFFLNSPQEYLHFCKKYEYKGHVRVMYEIVKKVPECYSNILILINKNT